MDNIQYSKRLAYLLRHDKKYAFDSHGWRSVEDLIDNHGFSVPLLLEIVKTNNKQRYEFNEDGSKIRARQGHSINVDVELKKLTPPDVLYHGTSIDSVDSILKLGLRPQGRLYVHLSCDQQTALEVGRRHGKPAVLKIDANAMKCHGLMFFYSANGIWLTNFIDSRFISWV